MIVAFAVFTAVAAVLMLSGWRPRGGGLSHRGQLIPGLSGGSALGFFAGLLGRGGGSFVVPLLYIAGLDAKMAAATSAFVVSGSGVSSFVSHLATAAQPQWVIWGLCVLFVLVGSQLGSRFMVARLKRRGVKLVFGIVLLGVAAILIIKDVILT